MAESAVNAVLGNSGTFVAQEITLLCEATLEVEFLKDELKRLQGFLRDVDSKWRLGDPAAAVLVSQIRDAAYEADNVIEAAEYMRKRNMMKKGFMGAIARYARLPSDLSTLHKVGVEIKRIKRKISEICESANRLKIVNSGSASVENVPADHEFPQDYDPMHQNLEDVVVVGFEDEYKEIVEKLVDTKRDRRLSAISIVAMGGAGKTTLARKVCTSSRVKHLFRKIAWVTVSQKYKSIDLLKDIMKQITGGLGESTDEFNEYALGNKIRDFLLPTRYLVVLDDVWETNTWEELNRTVEAFPDANNGSRILLTTRKEDVANHVHMPTHVHPLKKLDKEQSWELFSRKALPSYRRLSIRDVDELEELGRKLARKCDGLPLALSVLGGYLSKNLNTQAWSDVLLDWPSTKDTHMMREILARSYKDLPSHYLRSCFLYLASFPEDFVISVSDLIELWIAERFIPHRPNHTLEQTSRMYVTELAQRSLVQVVDRSMGHGWIETLRIHDILRDWCIQEARQDGFLNVVGKTAGQVGESSSDTMRSYRCSLQKYTDVILQAAPNIQTLICFRLSSVSLPKLRFLRVLYIENSVLMDFSRVIGGSIHLRCLKLKRCRLATLPSSIGKLLYLQVIDLSGTMLDYVVPRSLWSIPTLRHAYLSAFSPPARNVQQKELRTLCLERCSRDMVVFLSQTTQLTTFSLAIGPVPKGMIEGLGNMPHLVHISVGQFDGNDIMLGCCCFTLGRQRRYPCLEDGDGHMTQDPMPILEKLPCLVVLRLSGYQVKTIFCSAQGFPRLRELQLRHFSTEEWILEEGAMPKLSHLTLWDCSNMRRLPKGLLNLRYLTYLKVCDDYLLLFEGHNRGDILKEIQKKGFEIVSAEPPSGDGDRPGDHPLKN